MRSVRSLFCGLLLALLGTGVAQAQTTLYTSAPMSGAGSCLSPTGTEAATDITTPAGTAYQITSASVGVNDFAATASQLTVSVYSDASGAPGASVATLGTAALSGAGSVTLNVTPAAPVALTASTRYWIVVSTNSTGACDVGWHFGSSPSGLFTHSADANLAGGTWSSNPGANFEVSLLGVPVTPGTGTAVAVPTLSEWTLLLLAALLGLMAIRQTRRRSR